MRQIPFFNYPHVYQQQKEEILASMMRVMERGAFILQEELFQFEREIARFVNAEYAVGVANGTESMFVALLAAGIGPGDEVILCSHTYIATAAAVHFTGATPVLVDCGEDRLIDPVAVENAVTSRTRAVMPTHLNGRTCNMDRLQAVAAKHGLIIIEDAAQALGSKFKGRSAGTFGFAGSVSLYPAKVLGCFGDGGVLFTNAEKTYEQLLKLHDHGRDENGMVVTWGVNSRLDTLQAAVLLPKLKNFPNEIIRRRKLAQLYTDNLKDVPELRLPPAPDADNDHFDIYQNYELEAENRDELRQYLKNNGVGSIIQWGGTPVHKFTGLGLPGKCLPVVEEFFRKCFLLPMNTSLSDDDVYYICEIIRKFYGGC
ncbi:MAG: DegT/DnrJ/EryC1/StrS family aminotransferase [Victivallaceae bacterium]|nr:DegT/DnrJ/EryC1/StrS family aminotransferase [Victivallaceae bacterium]